MKVLLDFGHGGVNPLTGVYTTAPNKMFNHRGSDHKFHSGTTIYEGVLNRQIGVHVMELLTNVGIAYAKVAHDWIDTPLYSRVNLANQIARANPQERHVYISIHNNASSKDGKTPGKGRGTEVFTTPGQNNSDKWASTYIHNLGQMLRVHGLFEAIPIRGDWADGDADKEANFQVIRGANMPAILVECLFFDNLEDAKMIFDPSIQLIFATAIVSTVLDMIALQ